MIAMRVGSTGVDGSIPMRTRSVVTKRQNRCVTTTCKQVRRVLHAAGAGRAVEVVEVRIGGVTSDVAGGCDHGIRACRGLEGGIESERQYQDSAAHSQQ